VRFSRRIDTVGNQTFILSIKDPPRDRPFFSSTRTVNLASGAQTFARSGGLLTRRRTVAHTQFHLK
jgi:hypothetical protein